MHKRYIHLQAQAIDMKKEKKSQNDWAGEKRRN
jgi:hypothetical protein